MTPKAPSPRSKPSTPAQEDASGTSPHTGSGAHTALEAMLKKRKMRASRDAETQAPPPDDNGTPACDK